MNKKIILFDIDYTFFDTTHYKNYIAEILGKHILTSTPQDMQQVINEVYSDVRSFGSFDPKIFAKFFKAKNNVPLTENEIEAIWWNKQIMEKSLYPEVEKVLATLSKRNEFVLGIFSSGKTEFQLAKISFIQDFFTKEHIHIASFKEETLPDIINEYKKQPVTFVDDYIEILQNVKKLKNDAVTVWIKRGKFAEKAATPLEFPPDEIITSLDGLLDII